VKGAFSVNAATIQTDPREGLTFVHIWAVGDKEKGRLEVPKGGRA
jgi:hypothetical protein